MGWVTGATMNICGSIMINCGTNIMKLGHSRFQKRRRRYENAKAAKLQLNRSSNLRARVNNNNNNNNNASSSNISTGDVNIQNMPSISSTSSSIDNPPNHILTRVSSATGHDVGDPSSALATPSQSNRERRCVCSLCQGSLTCSLCPPTCVYEAKLLSKTWVIGMLLFSLGSFLNFLSFSYAAQSLLASLGSVQFVTNVFFAHAIIKEPIRKRTIIGTIILVVGVCLVVAYSCHGNPATTYSLEELEKLFVRQEFVVYLIVLCTIWIISLLIDKRLHQLAKLEGKRGTDLYATPLGFSYAAMSAIIGAQSVTLFKIVSELLTILAQAKSHHDISAQAVIKSPFFYGMILAAFTAAFFWIYRLNRALEIFDAMFIVPLFQVFWITLSVIGGGIFFREFEQCFHGSTAVFFVMGLIIIFIGVFLLSPRPDDDPAANNTKASKSPTFDSNAVNTRPSGGSGTYENPPLSISRQNSNAGSRRRSPITAPPTGNGYVSPSPIEQNQSLRDPLSLTQTDDNLYLRVGDAKQQEEEEFLTMENMDSAKYAGESHSWNGMDDYDEGGEYDSDEDANSHAESDPGAEREVMWSNNNNNNLDDNGIAAAMSSSLASQAPNKSQSRFLRRAMTGLTLSSAFLMPMLDAHDIENLREKKRRRSTSQSHATLQQNQNISSSVVSEPPMMSEHQASSV